MKITIAQLNPTVGHIEESVNRILEILSGFGEKSDLIVFPELFLVGYPPRDLLEKSGFIEKTQKAINKIVSKSKEHQEVGILLGAPMCTARPGGKKLYNSAILIQNGKILGSQEKSLLPTYDVFDETRYFDPAPNVKPIQFKDKMLGVSICEDMWDTPELWPEERYNLNPIEKLAQKGALLLINLSASPFYAGKEELRYRIIQDHARKYALPFLFVNQVGSNDELVFDGRSVCVDKNGEAISVFPAFKEHVETVDVAKKGIPSLYVPQGKVESVYEALILGTRDYMRKCGFSKAVIGLSGGIDSSVACCLAKEAVGKENVLGISMPSPYSAKESMEYACILTKNLGVGFKAISISEIYSSYIQALKKVLKTVESENDVDIYLQNIQARIRGNILMAFSNKYGYLVLSTGNKSELAVGYCTLYGDMAGGLAVISDVPKTMIYELANYINRNSEIIPEEIIKRVPSAELKFGQCDQDTLPPYKILDEVLYYYLEEGSSVKDLTSRGFDPETVEWIVRTVNKNEYKRRQAAPGLKVTSKAFGMGRRMPIAAEYGE